MILSTSLEETKRLVVLGYQINVVDYCGGCCCHEGPKWGPHRWYLQWKGKP